MCSGITRIQSELKFYSIAEEITKTNTDMRYFMIFFIFNDKTYLYGLRKVYWESYKDSPFVKALTGPSEIPVNEVVKDENGKYIHFLSGEIIKVSPMQLMHLHSFTYRFYDDSKTDEAPKASKLIASLNSHMFIEESKLKMKEKNYGSV